MNVSGLSINDVTIVDLTPVRDARGSLTTLYKDQGGPPLVQWNLVRSGPNVLRGCHVHGDFDEVYIPLSGMMFFALIDIRPDSPTYQTRMTLRWRGQDQQLVVPQGVLHGVYCEEPAVLAYGLTAPYTGAGEFGCRWDDHALAIDWPTTRPVLSERDAGAGTYARLLDNFAAAWLGRTLPTCRSGVRLE